MAGSAPSAIPSRIISASPRVIRVAWAFSPNPSPAAIPLASAMTFFTEPPNSAPTTSVPVYGRKYGDRQARWTISALPSSAQAIRVAAGWRWAISRARFGPDTTTIRSRETPATSSMTSLIRLVVPSSMPFISETSSACGSIIETQCARFSRSTCDGMASTTMSAPRSASAASVVADIRAGSSTPGW